MADFERDIIVEKQSGVLKWISILSATYLPLQYPIIFPRGEDGVVEELEFNSYSNAPNIKRKNVTLKEWFAYKIQHRQVDLLKNFSLFSENISSTLQIDLI